MSKSAILTAGAIVGITLLGLVVSALAELRPARTLADGVATVTPERITVNLYAAVSSNGSGAALASAQLLNGQAVAEIKASGAGRGDAQAQAPLQSPQPLVLSPQLAATPVIALEKVSVVTPDPRGNDKTRQVRPEGTRLIVTGDVVNVRNSASTAGEIVSTAYRGQQMSGLERSEDGAWWRIGDGEWVYYALVEEADSGKLFTQGVPASPQPTVEAMPTALIVPVYPFALELIERHREVNNVTLYAFIHEDGRALDGHYLNVTVNGLAVPAPEGHPRERSAAVPLGETRPACKGVIFDVAVCAENRIYNLKQSWDTRLMFPTFSPWGVWRVQLVDGAGQALGPWATFEIQPGQTDLELYVRYSKEK